GVPGLGDPADAGRAGRGMGRASIIALSCARVSWFAWRPLRMPVLMQHQRIDLAAGIALEIQLRIDHGVEEMILRLRVHRIRGLASQLDVELVVLHGDREFYAC